MANFLFPLAFFLVALPLASANNSQYYTFSIGDAQGTVLSDGKIQFPTRELLTGVHPKALEETMSINFLPKEQTPLFTNPIHLELNGRRVLIDAGSSPAFPGLGKLLDNMAAAGLDPNSVEHVILSHAHFDHIGGVVRLNGSLAFPNAVYHMSRLEYEYWTGAKLKDMPKDISPVFRRLLLTVAKGTLAAIESKLKLFEFGDDVLPGIKAKGVTGHTPGHSVFVIRNGNESLMTTGDALSYDQFNIQHPDWKISYDVDQDAAIISRYRLLKDLAYSGMLFLSYHNDFPGLGRIYQQGQGYALRAEKHVFYT